MTNQDGSHHTFVIAKCGNNRTVLYRHILRWQQIHGPNTRVLVDPEAGTVHLMWEKIPIPQGLVTAESYLGKS